MGFMCPGCGCGVASCAACTSLPPLQLTDSLFGGPFLQRSTNYGADDASFDASASTTAYSGDISVTPFTCSGGVSPGTTTLYYSYGLLCLNDGTYQVLIRVGLCSGAAGKYPWADPRTAPTGSNSYAHNGLIGQILSDKLSGPFDCANPSLTFTFVNWQTGVEPGGVGTNYPHASGGTVTITKQ